MSVNRMLLAPVNMMRPTLLILLVLLGFGVAAAEEVSPLRVGVIFPFSGKQARQGELGRMGIELALLELPDFHPQLFFEDSQSDTNQAVAAFHKLRNQHQVDVVLTMGSPQAMALLPLANQTQTILLAMVIASNFSVPMDYGFRLMGTAAGFGQRMVELVQTDLGKSRIALVYVEDDYGTAYERVLRATLGPNLVLAEAYPPSSTDFRTILLKLKRTKPEAVVLASWAVEAGVLLRQLRELNLVGHVLVCPSACDNPDIAVSGTGATDPLVIVASSSTTTVERTKALVNAFHEQPTSVVLRFFDAITLLRPAFQQCSRVEKGRGECLRRAVASTSGLQGSSYPISFDGNGDIIDRYQLKVVRDGRLVPATVVSGNIIVE